MVGDDAGSAVMVVVVGGAESGTGTVVISVVVGSPETVVVTMTVDAVLKLVDGAGVVTVDEEVTVVMVVTCDS